MMKLPMVSTRKVWARCPHCGAKTVLHLDTAECSGVLVKCTRGCGQVFELVLRGGKQMGGGEVDRGLK